MNIEVREIFAGVKTALRLMGKHQRMLAYVASGIMLVSGFLTNVPALILGNFVNHFIAEQSVNIRNAIAPLSWIIIVILVRESLTVVRKYMTEFAATQTEKEQTVHAIQKLLSSETSFLQQQQIGALHGRVFRSIEGLVRLIKLTFLDFLPTVFNALGAIAIALLHEPLLGVVMVLVIPVGLFIIFKQIASQKGVRLSLIRGKEHIDGTVVEVMGGIETVRTLHTESQELARIEEVGEQLRIREMKHHLAMALYDSLKYLNEGLFYVVVVVIAIGLAAKGIISSGDILVFSVLFLSVTSPLREIHRILDEAHENTLKTKDLVDLLERKDDVSFEKSSEKVRVETAPVVVMEKVTIGYPGKDDVLKNLSLKIKEGENIGIVGASGGGKSTLIRTLLRLHHTYKGTISFFGTDLRKVNRSEISRLVAYVPQQPYIFSGTIRENIVYGAHRNITDDEVRSAAEKAHILEEIERDLGGFDGKVTERGGNLSGGQRQRLAIARVILKSPRLIILDEATSALDNLNEARIQEHFHAQFKGHTVITIAHRLSTLQKCDRILVFEAGKIVQEGSYSVLESQKGVFQDMLNHVA